MNIGVIMWPIKDWPTMGREFQRAEELGFHTAWLYDHLSWRGHTPWDDAFATLAAAAAITSRIRLGPLVTSPNFRHPVPTASAIKTIDRVSEGRLTLGIGSGGTTHASGDDSLGQDWTRRERTDRFVEWVTQLDGLLTQDPYSADGEHWTIRDARICPGLVQQRPPFLIAAEGLRGMRLAARFGQGWISNPHTEEGPALADVRSQLAKFEEVCAAEGRDPGTVSKLLLTGFTQDPWLASAAAFEDLRGTYEELGFTDIALHWPRADSAWDSDPEVLEQIAQSR